jgi:hypothetical protein
LKERQGLEIEKKEMRSLRHNTPRLHSRDKNASIIDVVKEISKRFILAL